MINEKLMVRVGGGYVGMDEFMMMYGPAHVIRTQKEQQLKGQQEFDFIRSEILIQYFKSNWLTSDDYEVDN